MSVGISLRKSKKIIVFLEQKRQFMVRSNTFIEDIYIKHVHSKFIIDLRRSIRGQVKKKNFDFV